MNSKIFKSQANDALAVNKRENSFALIVFLGSIIPMVLTVPLSSLSSDELIISDISTLLFLALSLLYTPINTYAISHSALKVLRNEDIAVNDLLSGFSCLGTIIVYNIVTSILTILGYIAFIIPGIMLTYS